MLAREFGGCPVSNQNLCEWRAGGFVEWQARQETLAQTRELAAEAAELEAASDGRLSDHLATVLAARYAAALAGWNGTTSEDFRRQLRTLRGLCQDIVELRRGDHSGARLQMERERMERARERTEEEVAAQFEEWAKNPQVRDWICRAWVTPEERRRRLQEILGLPPEPPAKAPPTASGSSPVKPSQTESSPGRSVEAVEAGGVVLPSPGPGKPAPSGPNPAPDGGRVTPHGDGPAHVLASLRCETTIAHHSKVNAQ